MYTLYTIWTNISLAFAGIGQYIVHWGFFGSLAAGLIAAAWLSPVIPIVGPYLVALRKDLYWAAFGCVLIMYGMYVGGKDAALRCEAKQVVISNVVTKAVKKTTTPKAQHQKDRWDKPEY